MSVAHVVHFHSILFAAKLARKFLEGAFDERCRVGGFAELARREPEDRASLFREAAWRLELAMAFEPGARLIKGDEEVTYVNNSPDTLREMIFKIYVTWGLRFRHDKKNIVMPSLFQFFQNLTTAIMVRSTKP